MQLVVGRAATVAEGMIYVGGREYCFSISRNSDKQKRAPIPYLKDIISKIWLKLYKYREYWEMRTKKYLAGNFGVFPLCFSLHFVKFMFWEF